MRLPWGVVPWGVVPWGSERAVASAARESKPGKLTLTAPVAAQWETQEGRATRRGGRAAGGAGRTCAAAWMIVSISSVSSTYLMRSAESRLPLTNL